MKRTLFLLLAIVILPTSSFGQQGKPMMPATTAAIINLDTVPRMYFWTINNNTLNRTTVPADTVMDGFTVYNPVYKHSIANSYMGNLGLPNQSMIYFDRPIEDRFMFLDVYRDYAIFPEKNTFINTRFPYTNFGYTSGGGSNRSEESLTIYHAQNITPDLNFAVSAKHLYGRGLYDKQSTRHLALNVLVSYIKPKYNFYLQGGRNKFENFENGGVQYDSVVTKPVSNAREETFPVNLTASTSLLKHNYLNFKHRYQMGFYKEAKVADSTIKRFIPVTSIVHSMDLSSYSKAFNESAINQTYFPTNYISKEKTADWAEQSTVSNRVAMYLSEGLNKYTPFGVGVFIEHEYQKFGNTPWSYIADTTWALTNAQFLANNVNRTMDSAKYAFAHNNYSSYATNNVKWGGELFSRNGKYFQFESQASIYILGYKAGDYNLSGSTQFVLPLRDSVIIKAGASFTRETPDYFMNHYYSNHFWWNNGFDATLRNRLWGTLNIPAWRLLFDLKTEVASHLLYFGNDQLPSQNGSEVAILNAGIFKQLAFGMFRWNNEIVYQTTSNSSVVPLPDFSAFSDFYIQGTYSKVLKFQFGITCRYNTAYYAPGYSPATGRFYNQNEIKTGNYPLLGGYANFHLKRMRFFIQNINSGEGLVGRNYFLVPHYPLNPRFTKIGISWNFYD